ncbi:MAG: hypothetical protein KF851_03405 [Pirellulaceae bacterium]|nr:hypothetical protein [Pirellulaceae bacterium]
MSSDATDKILFSCPTCLTKLAVLSVHAGKTVQCRCGVKVVVPLVASRAGTTPKPLVPPMPAATELPKSNTGGHPNSLPAKTPSAANAASSASQEVDYFKFSCTNCNGVLKVRETDRGKTCRCRCGVTLTIPTKPVDKVSAAGEAQDHLALDFDFNFDVDAFVSSQPHDLPEYLKPPPPPPPYRPY